MNSACAKVLACGQNACTAQKRRPTLWGPVSSAGIYPAALWGCQFESDQVHQKERHAAGRVFLFGVSPPKGRLHPPVITMLGGNELRLRQGFGLRPKRLYGAKAPPHLVGPHVLCRHLSCCIVGVVGSNPIRSTIKAKQHRCRRPEAYGIYTVSGIFQLENSMMIP